MKKINKNKASGIYKIENILNGDFYIGQAYNFNRRKYGHFYYLRKNLHGNKHLQNAFNKYGDKNFIFKIILICEPKFLTYYEQLLVNKLNPAYNIYKECVVSRLGIKMSEESKIKISNSNKGKHTGQPLLDYRNFVAMLEECWSYSPEATSDEIAEELEIPVEKVKIYLRKKLIRCWGKKLYNMVYDENDDCIFDRDSEKDRKKFNKIWSDNFLESMKNG